MSARILLIENDTTVAKALIDALTRSSDVTYKVKWVRSWPKNLNGWIATRRHWLTSSCPTAGASTRSTLCRTRRR